MDSDDECTSRDQEGVQKYRGSPPRSWGYHYGWCAWVHNAQVRAGREKWQILAIKRWPTSAKISGQQSNMTFVEVLGKSFQALQHLARGLQSLRQYPSHPTSIWTAVHQPRVPVQYAYYQHQISKRGWTLMRYETCQQCIESDANYKCVVRGCPR